MLDSRLGDDVSTRKFTRAILDEVHRLDGIIRNLLTFARPPKPQMSACDLQGVIDRVSSLLAEQAARAGVVIETEEVERDLRCWADSSQLTQVLLNLVLNAIQASEGGGKIRVMARGGRPGGAGVELAHIDVIDNGAGVPAEVRESLFEPFVTTKARGTGLGLAISQQIIEEHEGSIECEFRRRGTCFSIELPRLGEGEVGGTGAASTK